MPRLLIPDGLTITAEIELESDKDEHYPVLKIQYRPPMTDVLLIHEAAMSLPGANAVESMLDFLEKHLVGWDVTDEKDQPVPHTRKNLIRVPASYLYRMNREISNSSEKVMLIRKN